MTKGASLCNSYEDADDGDSDGAGGVFATAAGDDASTRRNRPQIALMLFNPFNRRRRRRRRRRTLTVVATERGKKKEKSEKNDDYVQRVCRLVFQDIEKRRRLTV